MQDWFSSLQAALAGRYELQRELGRGGMAIVHLARDLKHDRPVAIKVLRWELTSPSAAQRFLREINIVAQLQHPHILPLFDSGEVNGLPYYVMPYVEGESLRDRLLREQRLALPEALEITREVASALGYAHGRGVVHRDIKPENVLLSGSHAVVADFGIARALGRAAQADEGEPALTLPGGFVGTVAYMSPEQMLAGREVDGRSDIYSLGCMLFEVLSGQLPFEAAGPVGLRLGNARLRLTRLRPEVPPYVELAVDRALAAEPDERWSSAAEFIDALTAPAEPGSAESSPGAHAAEAGDRRPTIERSPGTTPGRTIVGRQAERAELRAAYRSVCEGQGLLVSVTGEPGIGKTAFVEDFLAELTAEDRYCSVARGRCSERLAGAEAYLPLLEALDSLLREESGVSVAGLMRMLAPSWYTQVAPRSARDAITSPGLPLLPPPSQERMKRELTAFLQAASKVSPLVIFLDDVHWADASTVDMLAYLAGRFDTTRTLVVATCRPTDLLLAKHPFGALKLDLQARRLAREIVLPFLAREDIEHYLALRFPGHDFPAAFPTLIHEKTEGSPLFMVDLIRYLHDRKLITGEGGREVLARPVLDIGRDVPESVRSMVQRNVERLSDSGRRLLAVASIQGVKFDSAVIARVLGRDAAEVEEELDALERVYAVVRRTGEHQYPDRTLSGCYRFVHVLYQNALFATVLTTRRAALSGAVAQALSDLHGDQSAKIATELAILFETARDAPRAAQHFLLAARSAVKVFANEEAITLARRGLVQVAAMPDSPERAQLELALNLTLGYPLMAVRGYAAAEVQQAFNRASELSRQLGARSSLFPALWGLWGFYFIRAELTRAREFATQLLQLGESAGDPALLVQGHLAMGMTLTLNAELEEALAQLNRGIELYDPQQHRSHMVLYGHDPLVVCMSMSLWVLWLLGYPDQALERSRRLHALATELAHPQSLAFALHYIGTLHHLRREPEPALEYAEAAVAVATEHSLLNWRSWATVTCGWAVGVLGDVERGITMIRDALVTHRAMGAGTSWPNFLLMLAELLGEAGRVEEALSALEEGLGIAGRTGERRLEAELVRFKAELLGRRPASAGQADAEATARRAAEMARAQRARSLELRSMVTLCRLLEGGEGHRDALRQLASLYEWFGEGFDTPDLRAAATLLGEEPRGAAGAETVASRRSEPHAAVDRSPIDGRADAR